MKTILRNLWYRLRSSFLFLPALLAAGSILISFITVAIDKMFAYHLSPQHWWLYSGGPDGARAVLSVISSSMITVAGVVFSITIVVLSLASSQFGPRLIRNFMNVRSNQLVLGTFVATYTYGILVLQTINSSVENRFVPRLSVTIAIAASLFSIAVLIYFIHSVSESIQAQNIIDRVSSDLAGAVDRIFPEKLGDAENSPGKVKVRNYDIPTECDREACQVIAASSGYFQAIDNDALMEIAVKEDLLRLRIISKPFTFAGMVDEAFNVIRQNSSSIAAGSIRLLETIATIGGQAHDREDRAALLRHAAMINEGCNEALASENDKNDVAARYQAAVAIIEEK